MNQQLGILPDKLTHIFGAAVYGGEEGYLMSKKGASELIDYARDKFEALAAGSKHNSANIKSVYLAINLLKQSFGNHYDMWVLDSTHDKDPLNGRSNAEMQYALYERAGLEDLYKNNRTPTEIRRLAEAPARTATSNLLNVYSGPNLNI